MTALERIAMAEVSEDEIKLLALLWEPPSIETLAKIADLYGKVLCSLPRCSSGPKK
jgi:hypothetical protein